MCPLFLVLSVTLITNCMSSPRYPAEYLEALRKNANISSCTERRIVYKPAFRAEALARRQKGESANAIFLDAGIDLAQHPRQYCKNRLKLWSVAAKKRALGLKRPGKRGRPKRPTYRSAEAEIKALRLEVAYLKRKNNFLARLRALRTE